MTYNITSIDNTTSFNEWVANINSEANGYPAISFIIVLWIATYIYATNRNLDPSESLLASNFLTLIISGLLYFASMISLPVVITLSVLTFLNIVYLNFK